jgi:hypothetical protein
VDDVVDDEEELEFEWGGVFRYGWGEAVEA